MRLWVADFQYLLARALRSVGVGLVLAAWASVLASEAQQYSDLRGYAIAASAVVGVVVSQLFAGLPPSAKPVDVVRGFERDIVAVAREQAPGDTAHQQRLTVEIAALAVDRIRDGANVPGDRRAWLRLLGELADTR